MRAVFLDAKGLEDLDLTELMNSCSSLEIFATTPPELVDQRIADAELVIVNKTKLNEVHFRKTPSLKLICLVATGTDVIDLVAANKYGVAVYNCQNYGTNSVVQHVFANILALQTNLLRYNAAVTEGRWQQADQFCFLDFPITELHGKKLGIVGFGNLGRGVAKIGAAFGMEILVARRPGTSDTTRPALTEILPLVDILTLHCPLTESTRDLIDCHALSLMKPTALLINAARGGIVNETDLVDALRSGNIGGAAVDVLTIEPPRASNPLLEAKLPQLIITPHCAWASHEARATIIKQTVENIAAFLQGSAKRRVTP